MNRLFASLPTAALAAAFSFSGFTISASAQTRPGTAPTRPLANPFGVSSAIGGQSRPLGGVPATGYHNNFGYGNGFTPGNGFGKSGDRRRFNGPYNTGAWGIVTYVPNYYDYLGDPVSGPYSYTAGDYYAAPPPPPAAAPPAPSGPAPPTVIINQYYGYPGPPSGPPPDANGQESPPGAAAHPGDPLAQSENYYLIAYKDHSIHAALAYWVEGNTLHYVTTENAHNQVSLDLVDIAESTKLNSDHNVPFSISAR